MKPKQPFSETKKKKILLDFLKNKKLAVLSTVAKNGLPESSLIGVSISKNFEIICSSYNTSRKYENLQTNSRVSLVIGWEKGQTVQYEGVAKEVPNDELELVMENYLKDVKSIAKYVPREFGVIYRIIPKWIRFSNLSTEPWERFEIKF